MAFLLAYEWWPCNYRSKMCSRITKVQNVDIN
uniref:Uncharacterized protein n=1 Tax=Arundo donax TaxID=35708 RepID=A0A0A8YCY1_ARUDO